MSNKTLYWIRHGESLSNISESNYKIIDPSLTSKGFEQCNSLKKYLEINKIIDNIDLIVVSPLNRTLETCMNIIDKKLHNNIPIISLDEIRELIDHPCHKRISIVEKKNKYSFVNFDRIYDNQDNMYNRFNGNEPKKNVINRCEWFINWLKKRKEKNIMVITHGNFLFPMFSDVLVDVDIDKKGFFSNCELRKNTLK
jgi:broad specificity phosphatase PhoE